MVVSDDKDRMRVVSQIDVVASAMTRHAGVFCVQEKAVALLDIVASTIGSEGVVDMKPLMSKYTLDVLGKTVFGIEFDSIHGNSSAYMQSYNNIIDWFRRSGKLSLIPGFWSMKFLTRPLFDEMANVKKITTEIIEKKLQTRSKSGDSSKDLLDMMLDHHSDLSDDELRCNIWILFSAGHETSSSTVSMAAYYFAKYPEYLKLAIEEVDRVIGKNTPTQENTKGLEFLDIFFKEVLRKSPPVQLMVYPRHPIKDVEIDGNLITTNTTVNVAINVIHHLEEFWPEPEKFNPFRFTEENSKNRHHYAYLPFSLGRRHCIGNTFANVEMKIFMAALLQRFSVEYVEEPNIVHVGFADTPKNVLVKLKRRLK